MQLVIDKDWPWHGEGYLECDGTVNSIGETCIIIRNGSLYDVVGEDNHRYANGDKNDRQDVY